MDDLEDPCGAEVRLRTLARLGLCYFRLSVPLKVECTLLVAVQVKLLSSEAVVNLSCNAVSLFYRLRL